MDMTKEQLKSKETQQGPTAVTLLTCDISTLYFNSFKWEQTDAERPL